MTKNIRKYFLLPVFISLVLSGCFSPWKGDEATLTLLLGDGSGGRAMAPEKVVHTVELEGPTGKQTIKDVKQQLSVKVAPGYWKISIKASLDGKPYAEGKGGTLVKAGQNNQAEIKMDLVYTVTFDINGAMGTAPEAKTVIADTSITLPSGEGLNKSGFSFNGWNTKAEGDGVNFNAGDSYTVTGNTTLYAKWNPVPKGSTVITINFIEEKDALILKEDYDNIIISTVDQSIKDIFNDLSNTSFNAKVNTGFTANNSPEDIYIQWSIFGSPINLYNNKEEITINAGEYNPGTYELGVKVYINRVPYSAVITFEVRDWIGIKDLNDLKNIGKNRDTMRQKYRLLNEKEIRLPNDWTAIIGPNQTSFNGEFDGDNKKINLGNLSNDNKTTVSDNSTYVISLFAIIGTEGIVKNLELEGSIQASGQNTYVGAVAGIHNGIIQDVAANVSISLGYGAQTDGYDDHDDFPKGIVGQNGQGIVRRCTNTGSVQ